MTDLQDLTVTFKNYILTIIATASITASAVTIYMSIHENADRIEYVNERFERITKRLSEDLESITPETPKLDESN